MSNRDELANAYRLSLQTASQLRFELSAKVSELEIADGEIVRLRAESAGRHTANLALCEEIVRLSAEVSRLQKR